ncbi:uncharacterized protein LOC135579493 isoform X5 [Columba livia]|uniref:uncharacterized protein LOC135579493 isoform X5 n=1 Tax=Columba livia TaxID=8932 RepID=UPI0031BB4F1A
MATRGLLEMLNAAMGTPHLGVVDLVALHKLLEAIIGQLGQQELSVLEPEQSPTPGLAKDQDSKAQPGQEKEEDGALGTGQHLWKPKQQLDEKDTLEGTGSNSKVSSVAKEAMPKTTEEEKRDVPKKRASLQDLWEEISKFKEAQSSLEQDVREMKEAMQEAHSGLEQDIQEVKEAHVGLAEDMHALQEAHSGLAEDIQEIQETLGLEGGGGQSAPAEPTQVAMDSQARRSSALEPKGRGTQPGMETGKGTAGSGSPGMQAGIQGQPATPVKLSGAPSIHKRSIGANATTPGMQPGSPGTQASTSLGTQPGAPDAQASTAGMQAGSPGIHTTTPGVQPGSSSSKATIPGDAQEPAKPWGSTSTSSYESEMREVLSQVGQLGQLCAGLKEQVEQLKSTKAESTDLEDVRRLFPKGGRQSITSILADLRCQVSFLQDMARALHGEKEKAQGTEGQGRAQGAGEAAGANPGRAGAVCGQQVDEPRTTAQSGGHEHAGCHVCSPDTRVLLGKLLQRCEKLEEQVESLVQKAGSKVESHPKWRRQSLQQDEQLKCLQASIMQLQKDYEKLSSALANLQQDRQQKQNDIKALSQALGRLEKKQADKEEMLVLGIDEKADKAALADKVSRSQLEACEERLTKMMDEVTSQVTGQEKGWHQFQRELQRQMDCKLDRRELGAFRQQQEERWKSLSGQLQEKALQAERDDAAGIRKQLLPGFHCLSCDRPLNMLAPGPERTGECRYPTVPRSCGGPHTVTPPRFQPKPPSTPRPSKPSARSPNKKDAMQLSGQDGTDGNQQDEQLSMMGGSELPTMPRATPDTPTSRNRPSTRSSLRSAVLQHLPVSSPRRFTLAPQLLPPIPPPRREPTP